MKKWIGPLVVVVSLMASVAACTEDDVDGETDNLPRSTTTATSPPIATQSPTQPPLQGPTPEYVVDVAALSGFLEDQLVRSGAEGGLVAASVGGADPTVVSAGVTDATDLTPVPVDGAIAVASITKSYVAALLLSLQSNGLVDLDDPVGDYIAWPGGETITVRQLLDHTSGLGPWGNATDPTSRFPDTVLGDLTTNRTLASVVEMLRDVEPIGEPGRQTYYSNLNYLLAGRVAEVATGQPLAPLLAEQITGPLGLSSTYYPAGESASTGPAPLPGMFEYEEGVVVSTTDFPNAGYLSLLGPSAAGISSVADLFEWGDALFRDRTLGSVDLSLMLSIGPGGYGLGVAGVDRTSGTCVFDGCPADAQFEIFGLNGEVPGSSTRLWYDPEADTMVFLYLNRDGAELDPPMLELLALTTPPSPR